MSISEVVTCDEPLQRYETKETVWVAGSTFDVKVVRFSLDESWLERRIERALEEAIQAEREKLREFVKAFAPDLTTAFEEVLGRSRDSEGRLTP